MKYDLDDYYNEEEYDDEFYEQEFIKKEKKAQTKLNTTNNNKTKPNAFGANTKKQSNTNQINNNQTKNISNGKTQNNNINTNVNKPNIIGKNNLNKKQEIPTTTSVSLSHTSSHERKDKGLVADLAIANSGYQSFIEKNKGLINKSLDSNKPSLNLIVIGHVDAGKSTLMGHFLYKLGQVPERLLTKYEKESKQQGKSTFHFAWAMDERTEERKRGVTIDIAFRSLDIDNYHLTLMDAPGHRDFIPNMISGAAQADCALLIIDSQKDSFESGFNGGQTKEHATLALTLGVKQIIIVINKMETSNWSIDRYSFIKQQLNAYLISLGYKEENIRFIAVSGLAGTNLTSVNEEDLKQGKWYAKESLLEMINSFKLPERLDNYPVRFTIYDCGQTTVNNLNGFHIMGKLEGGKIEENDELCIYPINHKVKIRSLRCKNEKTNIITSGDSAEILLKNTDESVENLIKVGMILSSIELPIPVITEFTIDIMVLNIEMPLTIGQEIIVYSKSDKSSGKISKIHKITGNGKTKKFSPIIPKNHSATIDIVVYSPLCVEVSNVYNAFGRISLRDKGITLACGIITKLIK